MQQYQSVLPEGREQPHLHCHPWGQTFFITQEEQVFLSYLPFNANGTGMLEKPSTYVPYKNCAKKIFIYIQHKVLKILNDASKQYYIYIVLFIFIQYYIHKKTRFSSEQGLYVSTLLLLYTQYLAQALSWTPTKYYRVIILLKTFTCWECHQYVNFSLAAPKLAICRNMYKDQV